MKLKSFALGLGFAVLACVSTFAQHRTTFRPSTIHTTPSPSSWGST
jgi:hypothetical protein